MENNVSKERVRINKTRKYLANKKDFIEIRYEPKYAQVWIFFNDTELDQFEGVKKLQDGFNLRLPDGRILHIEQKLYPNEFVMKINGEFLPNTLHHPKYKLNSLYYLYVAVFILGIVSFTFFSVLPGSIFYFYTMAYIISVGLIIMGINFGFNSIFKVGLIGFILDTVVFTFLSLQDFRLLLFSSLWILFRFYVLFETFKKYKYLKEFEDYRKEVKNYNANDILA